ncbi:SNF2-related protein [Gordoniibacillus kamchatkensis]|uniref:SNF2-related protein n=1 Tax=Gordoniibacillus kamchatkensis TaxID=1590651 RepID=UPI001E29F821|nr:SNF2-related protein [Paenibacillus sp. VKM B-2647]
MIDTATMTVNVEWMPGGSLFLWGARSTGGVWDAMELKHLLFAWHAPSFYGTFVETAEWQGKEGVELPAVEALDYFAEPAPAQHASIGWSREAAALRQLAHPVRRALTEGRFMPDYAKWRTGEIGWKLELDEDVRPLVTPEVKRWLDALVPSWVDEDGAQKATLRRLEAAFPAMRRGELPPEELWLDEEDWLVAIGWQRDPSPFRTCLQLVEPLDGYVWQLRLVLQDRERKDVLRTVTDADGNPAPDEPPLPEAWLPELGRIRRDVAKMVRLVPWLGADRADGGKTASAGTPANATENADGTIVGAEDGTGATDRYKGGESVAENAARDAAISTENISTAVGAAKAFDHTLEGESATGDAAAQDVTGAAEHSTAAETATGDATGPDKLAAAAPDAKSSNAVALKSAPPARPGGGPDVSAALRSELTSEEAWRFLAEASVRLAEAGCAVFLPAWWDRLRKQRPRLKAKLRSSVGTGGESMFGLQQIMEFDWKLAVGDLELSEAEFRQLLAEKRQLVRIRGQWIQLDAATLAQLEQVLAQARKKNGLSLREALALHFAGGQTAAIPNAELEADEDWNRQLLLEVELNDQLRHMASQLTSAMDIPQFEPSASFRGTLRHYQAEGASWLLFLRRFGLGGCLADDMGLGKTIQWISYLLHVKENENPPEPSLLICPTSVLGNWQMELKRFAPSLRVYLHYGPQRIKGDAFREAVKDFDLVLTSYTLSHLDEAELAKVEWNSICLDEAQNIKNAYTKQASAIRRLSGYHRIALTGTPIENRLTELWSIFDFINPGYLGSIREFTHRYVTAIEKTRDSELMRQMQKLIRPFLLRRLKKDPAIQLDLPEKNESKTFISLTAEQGSLYENFIRDMFERIDKLPLMERRGLILSALTRLKQLCNHPSLLLREPASAPWRNRSNKVERLLEMVQELRQEGDRCLVFTQFVETGHMLQRIMEQELSEKVLFLHGGTPKATRDRMVAAFQNESLPDEEAGAVFLLSLKAGGTGLNLTAANHVFHFDRWWNPAVENQATDRAFRIGQTRHVQVHKFVTLGTLEERIDELIERKADLSQQIVGGGENWITELSTDELRDLFALRREWVEW